MVINVRIISCLHYLYLSQEIVDHLYVNTTRADKLRVSFDFSFPEVSCSLLSIDAVDETGLSQKDAVYEIFKHRLSKDGEQIGDPQEHVLGNVLTEQHIVDMAKNDPNIIVSPSDEEVDKCGNCYVAGAPGQCCQTCDEVKQAYEVKGWRFKPQGIKQCDREAYVTNMKDQFAEDGGCQLYGILELNKASGHFHIAPHKRLQENGVRSGLIDLMELISFAFSQFNITHTINSLSFGDNFPGINSPLDGEVRTVQDTHGMYQYYIKIVPTTYRDLKGVEIESNQYAVTEHLRHLAPGSGRGLPGIYFYYELSPIQAVFEEKRGSHGWTRFLTSACAIVGGSFTVMGIVDGLLQAVFSCFSRKLLT